MDRNHNQAACVSGAGATQQPGVPLRQATRAAMCRVVGVASEQDPEAGERLKQMGLCVGRQVQLIQAGDPLIVRLYGSRVALSARLAELVTVAPLACCRDAGAAGAEPA